ncbi:MAG TPA: hypothetical protein VFA11_15135 [Acidimicrobiales bacterium]|nr:hypothetical protein [Acidimicrobiales bacterium]
MSIVRSHLKKIVTGGLAATVVGGGAAAYALGQPAGPSLGDTTAAQAAAQVQAQGGAQGQSPSGAAKPNHRQRPATAGLMVGKVVSVTTSGGAYGDGRIEVQAPDGKTVTLPVSTRTRVVLYHGPGQHPTKESLSDLKTGEIVVLRVQRRPGVRKGQLGANPAATPNGAASGGSASGGSASGGAANPATPTTRPVLTLIIDTGFSGSATAAPTGSSASL